MALPDGVIADVSPQTVLLERLIVAAVFLLAVVGAGTLGYHYLGDGRWLFFDCFYMSVVTLSTVGFAETLPGMNSVSGARGFTVALVVLGSGTLLYFMSTLTAFIVEGDLVGALRRNRMQKIIDRMEGHVIVCGAGATGEHVLEELIATQTPFVAVDTDAERLHRLQQEIGTAELVYVVGDATDDFTLEQAGVARARGLFAALTDDKDNVYVAITARALNPEARIVAKAVETGADAKLRRAGADATVSPSAIGGMRMVSEMLRPNVVQFLDDMLRDNERNLRIEEIPLDAGARLIGAELRHTNIRQETDVLVIAVRREDGSYEHNPRPDTQLDEGTTLIVLAATDEIVRLREGIADGTIGPTDAG